VSAARAALVLASASPRRRELLTRAGLTFTVEPAGVDETFPAGLEARAAARELAERKARAVAARVPGGHFVLGADTIVALEEPGCAPEFLGKPGSPAEAAGMLRKLSGSRHAVVTGVCVVRTADCAAFVDAERTWVRMRALAPAEIEAYVGSGEWRDKAGGYAIQESADAFVLGLEEGGFDNVVGLPVRRTLALLAAAGAPLAEGNGSEGRLAGGGEGR
jgi:septum formation protein